jgi:hypothetical protein
MRVRRIRRAGWWYNNNNPSAYNKNPVQQRL